MSSGVGGVTPKQRIQEQIRHRETDFVPFAKLEFEGDVAERLDLAFGDGKWRATVAGLNHIRDVSAIVPLRQWRDETGPAGPERTDIFGSVWRTDARPWRLVRPALAGPDLGGYRLPAVDDFFPPGWRDRAIEAMGGLGHHYLVAGPGAGFFERVWGLRGFENTLMDSAAEPAFHGRLLDALTDLERGVLGRLLELPLDGVLFADDWADQRGLLVGPTRWRSTIRPRLGPLYAMVRKAGRRVLSHCCGNVREIIPDLIDLGLDVLQSIQPEAMDPYLLKREYGPDLTFWGGLGSQSLVPFGSPEDIRSEVGRLCRLMGRGGGYILGPAKYLQEDTPTANAMAVVRSFCEVAGVRL